MNAAATTTLIEACGLTPHEASSYLQVEQSTVEAWRGGTMTIDGVNAQKLIALLDNITERIDALAEQLEIDDDRLISILRYNNANDVPENIPLGAHHAIVRGVYSCDPLRVAIISFDRTSYDAFRGEELDTAVMRGRWEYLMLEIEYLERT